MKHSLIVFLGSGLGGVARHVLNHFVTKHCRQRLSLGYPHDQHTTREFAVPALRWLTDRSAG